MVVYPAMAVAAVLFICLFVTALGRAPGERKKTGRKSIKAAVRVECRAQFFDQTVF